MKNKKLISKLGYSDGSPFKDEPYLDIHTPNGKIDMSNTGVPLLANGRILPPYSGIHHFDTDIVREIPLPKAQSLGEIKDRLSNYLSGNEGLLPGNQTSIKQSVKDRLYNSVTPIAYDPKHAIKEFVAGKQLPFMWDGKETSFNEFQNQPMFRGDTEYGEYSKNASMDAWGNYLGMPQKYDTFKQSFYQPGSFSFNNNDDIWDDVLHLDIINKLKEGQDEQVYDSSAGGFSLNNYILKKELDKDIDMPYVSYRDENDYNIKLGPLNIEGESIVGNPFNVYGRMYYDPETNERLSEEDIYKLKLEKSKYRNLQKQEGGEYEELELTDEEIEEYKKGGYVVEELPKAQNGLIVHDQSDPRLVAYKDSLWLHENNLDAYSNWDGVWTEEAGNLIDMVLGNDSDDSYTPVKTSKSSIKPELSIFNKKSNLPLYTKSINDASSKYPTKNYYDLPVIDYNEIKMRDEEKRSGNRWAYGEEAINNISNNHVRDQAIQNDYLHYLHRHPEEVGKEWYEDVIVEGKSQDQSPYFKHYNNIPANKPEIYYIKDSYDRIHNQLLDTYFTWPGQDYRENVTHYARYAKPKQKVTYVPKNNVGDNANWPTSNSYKSSYGIIKKPSYADAYKNVDKDKYPTLESFIEAAENYKKYGSNTKPESKPEETKVLKSETKEKKLKKPTTKKEVIKKPEIPEGYALSKGYQRDGISYGDMWHDIESTRPSIPAGPTMKDYYAKYPKSSDIAIDDDDFQSGGTVSQLWKQATGTPWSEAKKQGLTDGSYANNIALRKRIISGEFNSVPSQTSSRYIKEDFDYEKYGENIKRLLEKGNTLDDLVRKRIGTRAGLTNMFPELFDMPQMPEIPEQTFEPLTQNLPDAVVEEDVEVSNNSMFNVPDWISNPVYSPPITPVTPNTQVKDSKEEPSKIPFWITKSPIELDPNYTFPEKNKKQDGLKSFLSQFENDQELLTDEQRQSLYLSVDQEKDVQKKAELIQQKEKEYLNQLKIEEQQRIDDYKNQMLVQYGKDKISDLKQVGKNVYEETISNINEIKNNTQEKSNKISYYIKNAPWEKGYKNITDYFKLIGDTYLRSEALISSGSEEATKKEVENTAFSKDVKRDLNDYYNNNFKNLYPEENEVKKLKTIKEISDEYKPIADIEKGIDDLGYNKTNYPNFKLGKVLRDNKGSSTHVIDMSDGINVTYQPRNENANKRSNVNNAVTVSDYLYDQDFTDGYVHEHAFNRLNKLKNKIGNFNKKDQKFVTIREKTGDDTWNVRVIPTSKLKESDFGSAKKLPIAIDPVSGKEHQDYIMSDNKVYSQGYAVLSDFDISSDGNKIKLYSGSGMFRNQGIPLLPNDSGHVLRLPGGVGNYGKYQSIDKLNSFGPYIGGTVTIISDDGKIVKKITGSLKDIVRTAQNIQKQTNGAEVHFLQSDAGSMNVKASANNNNIISKDRLNILRNNEPWAGGSEILLNKKVGGEINQFKLGGQYMDLDLTEEEIKEYQKGGFVVEDLPEYQAPPGQVISSTYNDYPFQMPEIVDTNLNDTIRPYSDKKRFNSYTITGDPNKPHRRSAGNIIYDMFHKPGSSEIKHDFNFKYGGENKYQTPPGEVKDLWNTLPNSYPEKGNPAIDMLDLDVFGILNDFVVQPAKRVIQDPVGTVKSIGNTAADVASFFNPFSIGSAEPLIESMMGEDINFGEDGNNAFGTPYWTDNALALDAAVVAPVLGSTFKTLKTLPNKFPNAYKYNPWAFKPNPEAGYRMIGGKEGYLDAIRSGEIRPTGAYEHAHFNIGQPLNPNRLSAEELIQAGSPGGYKGPYMAEMKQGTWQRMSDAFPNNPEMQEQLRLLRKDKDVWQYPLFGHIKVDDPRLNLYKEDWLRGYKPIGKQYKHQKPPGQVSSYGLHSPIDATNDWQVKREADGIDPKVQKRIDDYYNSIPHVVKDMNRQSHGMAEFTGIPSALRIIDHPKQIAKDVVNTVADVAEILNPFSLDGVGHMLPDSSQKKLKKVGFDFDSKNVFNNPYGSGIEGATDAMLFTPLIKPAGNVLRGAKNIIPKLIYPSPYTLNKTLKQTVVPQTQKKPAKSFFYGNNAYNQNIDEQLALANKEIEANNLKLKKLKNHKNKAIRNKYKDVQYNELLTSIEPLENVDEHIKPLIENFNNPAAREKLVNLGIKDPDDFMSYLMNEVQYTNIPGEGGFAGRSRGNVPGVDDLLNLGIGQHNKTFSHVPNIISNTGDHEIGHLMQAYMQKRGLIKKSSTTDFDKIASKFFRENKRTDDFIGANELEKYQYTQRDYGPNRENLLLPEDRYNVELSDLQDDLQGAKRNLKLDKQWVGYDEKLKKSINDHFEEATRNLDNFKKRFPNQDAYIDKTTMQLEPLPMLRELRNELYQSGAIKNFQDPIDDKILMNFWRSDNGKQNRILSFLQPSKKGRSGIVDLINKTPVVAGAIGTGTILSQEEDGGEIGYKSEEEIRDLINQGYDIEYLD